MNFPSIVGEIELENGRTTNGNLVLTNYRLLVFLGDDHLVVSIPIGLIDELSKNYQSLNIYTKPCRLFIVNFESVAECAAWFKRLSESMVDLKTVAGIFAFPYFQSLNPEPVLPSKEFEEPRPTLDRYSNSTDDSGAVIVGSKDSIDSEIDSQVLNQESHVTDENNDEPHDEDEVTVAQEEAAATQGNGEDEEGLKPELIFDDPLSLSLPEETRAQHEDGGSYEAQCETKQMNGNHHLDVNSPEKLSWIHGLSNKTPNLIVPSNYSLKALKCEDSLTYFEYHRLRFNDDFGYTSPNYVNNQEAFVKITESGVEQKCKPRWRISTINQDFQVCTSYPRYLIVPAELSDEELKAVANFRYQNRVPAITWRYFKNGCVLGRSSQPYVGWWGSRCDKDEKLFHLIAASSMVLDGSKPKLSNYSDMSHGLHEKAKQTDNRNEEGDQAYNEESLKSNGSSSLGKLNLSSIEPDYPPPAQRTLLISDCRSYTVAMVNRAKGGGCECPEYYANCDVQFMGLANIHSIRKSFSSLRYLAECDAHTDYWNTLLNSSRWLYYVSCLLKSALYIAESIDTHHRSCLIHCSDGWDRTPQLVSLVQVMLDPYYRTYEGFKVLIEKEWLEYGHKFGDRHAVLPEYDDSYEKCPIFQQWLDCVYQILLQNSDAFEFNAYFLETLLYHSYSCLFGTFIGNSIYHRQRKEIFTKTASLWLYMLKEKHLYINKDYLPHIGDDSFVTLSAEVGDLKLWLEVYCPSERDTISLKDIYSFVK